MLYVYMVVTLCLLCPRGLQARGAGRAFPIHAEEYAIDRFTAINPQIEWDPTNFLVDRSGQFATCDHVIHGYQQLDEMTPDGETIGLVHGFVTGSAVDAEAVNVYVVSVIDTWVTSHEHDETIRNALRFGCSVRPGCAGVAVVACLFSPGKEQQQQTPDDDSSGELPLSTTLFPFMSTKSWPPIPTVKWVDIQAQAFTEEQYDLAEVITGKMWDRSHFIENLSGMETSCSMLLTDNWLFKDVKELVEPYGINLLGVKGQAPNHGSTEAAMIEILQDFKSIQSSSHVGCSLIPDCMDGRGDVGGQMWVVVSCLYEEA